MIYKYSPDSYNYGEINEKFIDENDFINMQIKYKRGFEQILNKFINIGSIDEFIENNSINVPILEDTDYNFYHKYSYLNSNYIYIRNNIHVEKLNQEDLNYLRTTDNLDNNFYNKTLLNVVFEEGSTIYFEEPRPDYSADAKSLVFEFAYDQKKLNNVEELNMIQKLINNSFDFIQKGVGKSFNIKLSFIVNKGFDKELKVNDSIQFK